MAEAAIAASERLACRPAKPDGPKRDARKMAKFENAKQFSRDPGIDPAIMSA